MFKLPFQQPPLCSLGPRSGDVSSSAPKTRPLPCSPRATSEAARLCGSEPGKRAFLLGTERECEWEWLKRRTSFGRSSWETKGSPIISRELHRENTHASTRGSKLPQMGCVFLLLGVSHQFEKGTLKTNPSKNLLAVQNGWPIRVSMIPVGKPLQRRPFL